MKLLPLSWATRQTSALLVSFVSLFAIGCTAEPIDCEDGCFEIGGRFNDHRVCDVIDPPAELGLDPLYTRYTNCAGIAVVATLGVDDEALLVADETIEFMLTGNDEVRGQLINDGNYYILRGGDLTVSDLPEGFVDCTNENGGCMNSSLHAATSRGNELLCMPEEEWFYGANTFVHEFSHLMHLAGMLRDSEHVQESINAYEAARSNGLWDNTYAGTNFREYFAELTEEWFEVGRPPGPEGGDGTSNHIYSREALLAYDPRAHALMSSIYTDSFDVPGCIHRNVVSYYVDPNVSCPATVLDTDGNAYSVVHIGNQCWMASDLATTKFRNGVEITEIRDDSEWIGTSGPARCSFNHEPADVQERGLLYNHAAAQSPTGICPEGMRVPTLADMHELIEFVNRTGEGTSASQLAARGEWDEIEATDPYGFAARPTGMRSTFGLFDGLGHVWMIWTTDDAPEDPSRGAGFAIWNDMDGVQQRSDDRVNGYSIRCMSD